MRLKRFLFTGIYSEEGFGVVYKLDYMLPDENEHLRFIL